MVRLDHLSLPVRDWQASRDWYRDNLGLEPAFDEGRKSATLTDKAGRAVVLKQAAKPDNVMPPKDMGFPIQVDDLDAVHRAMTRAGIVFVHAPAKTLWGYTAEVRDPDGYVLILRDGRS
jgi:catechol 2,3-dioxygenase-like lactoylglutathione lyase family enzyme